ncbi:hypothetical protein [Mesorhizobium sp.]|uniref:hypothetical protein n=1 Tax=Mesorhizobium sp. TaxID=1871066 RepID=UPI000FD466AA|nr:hypothetical protein [Mesorhizobium sp.]RVC59826.1 hypothetical protein EN779_15055 [Mesorhizobium sp. M4B.F.Ca.ET.088.02.2.1]RWF25842.1 MAG: hypothetical protein EOS45_29810 [Mesorhizobium sp.]
MSGKKERKTINSEMASEAGYYARKCGLTRDEAIRKRRLRRIRPQSRANDRRGKHLAAQAFDDRHIVMPIEEL